MSEYIVESKSRKDLRNLALILRKHLGLDNQLWIPVVELLDVLSEIIEGFSYEIVPDSDLPQGTHAETNIRTGHITIKESVYERACNGEGRDRMTIAHEIGHFFTLCICGFKLQRNFGKQKVKNFNDPEWQAKCFAGEFLIPYHLTGGMTALEIASACGVSKDPAEYQLNHRN